MEIKICVADINSRDGNKRNGVWLTLPITISEFNSKVFGTGRVGEHIIIGYEAPFEIEEYDNIFRLNKIAEFLKENAHNPVLDHVAEILKSGHYKKPEDMMLDIDNIRFIKGDFYDLGYDFLHQAYDLSNLRDSYLYYEKVGEDLCKNSDIIEVRFGFIEFG